MALLYHEAIAVIQKENDEIKRMHRLCLPIDHACTRLEIVRLMIEQNRNVFRAWNVVSFSISYDGGNKSAEIFNDSHIGLRIEQLLNENGDVYAWLEDFLPHCYKIVYDYEPPAHSVTIQIAHINGGQRTSHKSDFPSPYGGIRPNQSSYTREQILLEILANSRQMFWSDFTCHLSLSGPAVKYGSCVIYESVTFGRELKILLRDATNPDLESGLAVLTKASEYKETYWKEIVFSTRWVRHLDSPDSNQIYEEMRGVRVKRNQLELRSGERSTGTTGAVARMMQGIDAEAYAYLNRREEELVNAISIAYAEESRAKM